MENVNTSENVVVKESESAKIADKKTIEEKKYDKFQVWLQYRRKEFGWTQDMLGEKIGVNGSTISAWEKGQ